MGDGPWGDLRRLFVGGHDHCGPGKRLEQAIAGAKPGDVITLAAGTYEGGIRLPAGVGLRGAGYRETTIVAARGGFGVAIDGGKGAEVADLSIRGGSKGLEVKGSSETVVRRVRVSDATNGIRFTDVVGGRLENVDLRRESLRGGRRPRAGWPCVNCTLVESKSLALSVASGSGHAAFNNCVVGSSTGVFVGTAEGLVLDHNLYFTVFVGKLREEIARRSLGDWKYLSGLDAHSVEIPMTYRDPGAGDYRPTGTLAWSQARASTSDWGVAKLAGFEAPDRDIDGRTREGRYDVGAYEVAPSPSRPADGTLAIRSDAGIKSAGIFDGQGREVSYLFHNLPLAAGEHPYLVPGAGLSRSADPRRLVRNPLRRGGPPLGVSRLGRRYRRGRSPGPHGLGRPGPGRLRRCGKALRLPGLVGGRHECALLRRRDREDRLDLARCGHVGGFSLGSDGSLYFGYVSGKGWDLVRIDPATGRCSRTRRGG